MDPGKPPGVGDGWTHWLSCGLMLRGQVIRQAAWMGEDSDVKVPHLILGTQPALLAAVHTRKLPLTSDREG